MKNFAVVVFALLVTLLLVLAPETKAMPALEDDKLQVITAVEEELEYEPVEEDFTGVVRADRHRRVTCDLLSFSTKIGSLNHAGCAAHCLAMRKGYRGGRCRDGVCHCRR